MVTLNNIMRANAISCLVFGAIFLLIPLQVAVFLGGDIAAPDTVIKWLGAILLINSVHLIWASFKRTPNKLLILYFCMGDFLWAIISVVLLVLGVWITTTLGTIVSILVAIMVTLFGVLQAIKLKTNG